MTHLLLHNLTLADSGVGTFVIFAIIAVYGIISAIVKKSQDQNSSGPRRSDGSSTTSTTSRADRARSVRERLNELAEQRRRQLQQMAQQKREEAMQQDNPLSAPLSQSSPTQSQADLAELQRRRAEAIRRAQDEQRAAQMRRMQAEHEQRNAAAREQEIIERQRALAAMRKRRRAPAQIVQEPSVHEQMVEMAARGAKPASNVILQARHSLTSLRRSDLRRAIIMMEVLEKPLALRDPVQMPMDR